MSFAMFMRIVVLVLFAASCRIGIAGTVLIVGDSLSAGYGLPNGSGWVSLLERQLADTDNNLTVVNASISGETTAGGKRRIRALLDRHEPQVVIVELGANDGLRGIHIPLIRENLAAIVKASQQSGARTLVIGMRIPPNYGRDYGEKFHALFEQVSKEYGAALLPFMLDGFAADRALFQEDGIHPTAEAQPLIMRNVYDHLKPLL